MLAATAAAVCSGLDAHAQSDLRAMRIEVRGVVRAVNQASVTTELPLRAIAVPFREGERFKRGDVLVAFDCRRQAAEHDAALAQHREAVLNLDSNTALDRHHAVGRNDLEISRARADRARAEVQALATKLDECQLIAPFDGRIIEVGVRVHERTVPQRPYLSIIDDSRLEIETIVPSSMLASLRPGLAFAFEIDELAGRSVEAEVHSIAAVVDPVSKSIKVIGIIRNQQANILAGMSGSARFSTGEQP